MSFNNFVGYENIIPLLAPQDITSTVTPSGYMNLRGAHKAAFLVVLGEYRLHDCRRYDGYHLHRRDNG